MRLTKQQAISFVSAFPIEEIKQYISDNKADYQRWLAEEVARDAQQQKPSPKRRVSRKGAAM